MILTLTPNTAIDRVLILPRLIPNRTLRASAENFSPTGKGVVAAVALADMGYAVTAMGFAAGIVGERLTRMVVAHGVCPRFNACEGETRVNVVIVGEADQSFTTITCESLRVTPTHEQALMQALEAALPSARCLVLGGSLPPGCSTSLYARAIALARRHQVFTILDASGEALRHALPAQPDWVKPNRDELAQIVQREVRDVAAAIAAAREVRARFGVNVLASLGEEGAVALTEQGVWRAWPVPVQPRNTAGAGDAMVGGLAAGLANQMPLEDTLRLSVAMATAAVLQLSTAGIDPADVVRLRPLVRVERC
ncbi:MAG: 1-phosphofructokinase family hexose kinase [Thermoflexales bacterium]